MQIVQSVWLLSKQLSSHQVCRGHPSSVLDHDVVSIHFSCDQMTITTVTESQTFSIMLTDKFLLELLTMDGMNFPRFH